MDWKTRLADPGIQYRPEIRWWLAEGFHTDQTLKNDISLLHDSGFGAIEFLAMDEPGADSEKYGWGSEEWVHDSHVVMRECTDRKMGASMTSGTNWSNANLITITPDDRAAAKELDFTSELLLPGTTRTGKLKKCTLSQEHVAKQELVAVLAMKRNGTDRGKISLEKDSAILLTEAVTDGCLEWTAPDDAAYELFTFWIHGTGQTASPSVGISFTINYIDRYGAEAFIQYWNKEVLTESMQDYILQNGRVQMYMDSLELSTYGNGGQFWGYHLLEEFHRRRGYDLTPYLPFVLKESGAFTIDFNYHYTCDDSIFLEKLYHDLYQTMTDLYMDNMLRPLQEWLHSKGMTLRAEISYGLPFEISQPGKYVDGIETESLEFCSQIESYRGLSGAAHLHRRLYSSETGATQSNYMLGLDFYTQIIYTQFAAGVSKTVLHGYSSIAGSEEATYWPGHEGMWPIFSERFGIRQPSFRHYQDWTAMLSRYQMLLRQGSPRVDIGILRLDYNFNNLLTINCDRREKDFYANELMRANEGLYWKDMSLQNAGYTYEYFAPQILEEPHLLFRDHLLDPEGPGYQALIIYQEYFPLSTAKRLLAFAEAGLPIIFVNGVNETIRPEISRTHIKAACRTTSLNDEDEQLAAVIRSIKALPNVKEIDEQRQTLFALQEFGIYPRAAFTEENKHFLTSLRDDGINKYLFVYHYTYADKEAESVTIALQGAGQPFLVNCWTGQTDEILLFRQENGRILIPLCLKPGEAAMLVLDTSVPSQLHATDISIGIPVKADGLLAVAASTNGICQITLSDGSIKEVSACLPTPILLEKWDLLVEDWNEGRRVTIEENRGLGIVTKEVYYETRKDDIRAGETVLKPWNDIEEIGPEVSGIGYYTTHITLPPDWIASCGTILKMTSVCQNTAAVYINGQKADPVDFDVLELDITKLLKSGDNIICIEVSSTLNNRLLSRGYFSKAGLRTAELLHIPTENGINENEFPFNISSTVQDYGLLGEVKLIPYKLLPLV